MDDPRLSPQIILRESIQVGDLIGFKTRGLFAWVIRLGQRLAGVHNNAVTHIAVVSEVRPDGDAKIIQSVRRVDEVLLSSYGNTPHVLIPFPGESSHRADVIAFARSKLNAKYGVLSVVSRGINTLLPKPFQIGFSRSGDCDCSTLGARAWEHGGVLLPWPDPWQIEPGQLCDQYGKVT